MTPAQRLLLVIGGCLILLVLGVFILYPVFRPADETTLPVAAPTQQITDVSTLTPLPAATNNQQPADSVPVETPVEASEAVQRAEAERLARLFVERFGSYSNFSNFENITSMEPFMTDTMKEYANALKKEPQNGQSVNDYYGVTSTIISLNTTRFSARQSASISFVALQETQAGLTGEIQTAYRDGRLELVYRDGAWLVNGLFYN